MAYKAQIQVFMQDDGSIAIEAPGLNGSRQKLEYRSGELETTVLASLTAQFQWATIQQALMAEQSAEQTERDAKARWNNAQERHRKIHDQTATTQGTHFANKHIGPRSKLGQKWISISDALDMI